MSKQKINEHKIIELYVDRGFSGREVSKQLGNSLGTIQKVLRKYHATRSLREARANLLKAGYKHPFKKEFNETRIILLYTKENVSIPKIAKIFGCSLSPIIRILKKNNVSITPSRFHKGRKGFWLGKKRPDISSKYKGRKMSLEQKEKLRLSRLGKPSKNKGKTYEYIYGIEKSKKLKEKLRNSHLGKKSRRKGKTFEQQFGETRAKEIKAKLAEKARIQYSSTEARLLHGENIRSAMQDETLRRYLSDKQKTYIQLHPEKLKKHAKFMKELFQNPLKRIENSQRLKKYYYNHPETRKQMSEKQKIIWSSAEKKEFARQRRLSQKLPYKNTLPELLVFNEMARRGIKFDKHKPILKKYIPDAVISDLKIAIFVDGDYWHANPEHYRNKVLTNRQKQKFIRDREQDIELPKYGWVGIRIWESEIKRNVTSCVDKIEEKIRQLSSAS